MVILVSAHNKITSFTLAVFALLFCVNVPAANISVMADRDPVVLNESFQLIFESDGSVDEEPDFAPLGRDFQVLSTNVSSNMNIVNGRISSSKRWQLTVLARRAGNLIIPSIRFGSEKSDEAVITVAKTSAGNNSQGQRQEVFLEAEVIPERPYVQSQSLYRVRLFLSVSTSNASLTDPRISGATAVIEKIGEDNRFQTQRDGKRYDVIERTYAIYPQNSGELTIEPVVFQGQISRGSSFFSNPFGPRPRTVLVQSEPLILNVLPIPDTFTGNHWLPARKVALTEEWSEDPPLFRIGEPITRTLILSAEGLTGSQLPELPEWVTSDFKQYPDLPSMADTNNRQGITARRTEKIAMIPGQAGNYVIPEISLPWWNTVTNKMEYARIPARDITVQVPVQEDADTSLQVTPVAIGELEQPVNGISAETNGISEVSIADTRDEQRLWQWISIGLLIAWLGTLLLWWLGRSRAARHTNEKDNAETIKKISRQLNKACRSNDAATVKECLLRWGRMMWTAPLPASIGEIGLRCSEPLSQEITNLNNALYGRNRENWDGESLWQAFVQEQKILESKVVEKTGELEPLYRL